MIHVLFKEMIATSWSICFKNMDEFGPVVAEIWNKKMHVVRMRTVDVLRFFMTAYLNRVHGNEQKPTMTLYLLNIIFTFKLAFKGLKSGPNLHS